MKKLLMITFLFLLGINLNAAVQVSTEDIEKKLSKQECSSIDTFSPKQIEYIMSSYIWGLPYGLELMLPAIAWQESCAGLYKVNMYDPSAGLYHAYLPTVMGRHKSLDSSKFTQNKIAQMLINDDKFAASEAIAELLFWKNYYQQNREWTKMPIEEFMLRSYNRGTSWHESIKNKESADNYNKATKEKMEKILVFIKKYDIDKEIKKNYNMK